MFTKSSKPSKQMRWNTPFFFGVLAVVGLALMTNAGCSKPKPPLVRSEALNDVIATIGDEQITTAQFSAEAANHRVATDPKARKALLDEMIQSRALGQEARRQGYDHDPQVIAAYDALLADRMRQETARRQRSGHRRSNRITKPTPQNS